MKNPNELRQELAFHYARMIRAQRITVKQVPLLQYETARLARMLKKSVAQTVELLSNDAMALING